MSSSPAGGSLGDLPNVKIHGSGFVDNRSTERRCGVRLASSCRSKILERLGNTYLGQHLVIPTSLIRCHRTWLSCSVDSTQIFPPKGIKMFALDNFPSTILSPFVL